MKTNVLLLIYGTKEFIETFDEFNLGEQVNICVFFPNWKSIFNVLWYKIIIIAYIWSYAYTYNYWLYIYT